MSSYFNPRFGVTTTTELEYDDADAIVDQVNTFLKEAAQPDEANLVLDFDILDDRNQLFFGLKTGSSMCTYNGLNLDLDDFIALFNENAVVDAPLIKSRLKSVLDEFPALAALAWTEEPRRFFVTHS